MQSILTNAFIAVAGRVANMILGVVALVLLTRYLGPQEYGSYVLVMSFGAMVQLAADLGLYLTLSSQIAQEPRQAPQVINNIVSLRAWLLLGSFIASLVLVWLVPSLRSVGWVYPIMFLGLAAQSISQLFMAIFQYYQTVWRATMGDLLGRIVQVVSIYVLGHYLITVKGMASTFMISAAVALLIHYCLLPSAARRAVVYDGGGRNINWLSWKNILLISWPLGVMLVLNAIYFRVDMVILSIFRPGAELGWYGAAYRVIESILFFPAMLGGLLLPRISEAWAKKQWQRASQFIAEGFIVLFPMALLLVVLLVMFGDTIILVIAGNNYLEAAPLLSVLGLALAIMFVGNLFGFALVAMHRQMFLLKLYACLVGFNLIANLLFVPSYGALAAAWITVATEAISVAAAAWSLRRTLSLLVIPYWFIVRVVLIALSTWLVAWLLPDGIPSWLQLGMAAIWYAAAVWLTKTVRLEDLRHLSAT